jgi:hypothetical protein
MNENGENRYYRALFAELKQLGYAERENLQRRSVGPGEERCRPRHACNGSGPQRARPAQRTVVANWYLPPGGLNGNVTDSVRHAAQCQAGLASRLSSAAKASLKIDLIRAASFSSTADASR